MAVGNGFKTEHSEWRETRSAKLAADTGWLNLAGRWWITPGRMSVGSGAENDIRLASGPGTLGCLTLRYDDTGVFEPVGGEAVDLDRAGGRWRWRAGRFLMEITALNDLCALRVRDVDAIVAADSVSIDFFPLDPALRVNAAWEALPGPMQLKLDAIIGIPTRVPVTHSARLTLAGQAMILLPTYGTADWPHSFSGSDVARRHLCQGTFRLRRGGDGGRRRDRFQPGDQSALRVHGARGLPAAAAREPVLDADRGGRAAAPGLTGRVSRAGARIPKPDYRRASRGRRRDRGRVGQGAAGSGAGDGRSHCRRAA